MDIGIKKAMGCLVREIRKAQKISQAELAARCGFHINTIHLLEAGKNEPKLSTLFFIVKGMNMDEQEFMARLCEKYYAEENEEDDIFSE